MTNKPGCILVTGACGFIGSHVVEHLLEDGFTVLAVDNFRTGKRDNLCSHEGDPNLSIHELDVGQSEMMAELVSRYGVQAIIHLAAMVSVQESIDDPGGNFDLNVANTQRMLELARVGGVQRFVFASSAAIYGDPARVPIDELQPKEPLSPYGMAKWVSEQLLEQYNRHYHLNTQALRFFNVYGPRQDPNSPYSGVVSIFSERMKNRQKLKIFGDGMQTRDFIYVGDVARVVANSATHPDARAGSYNVCTGEGVTLNELVDVLSKITGVEPEIDFLPPRSGDIFESVGCNQALAESKTMRGFAFTELEHGLRSLLAADPDLAIRT